MGEQDGNSEETIEELIESPAIVTESESTSRTVPVDPRSTALRPAEFHTQDWLLIAEALYKTTTPEYSYTNFFENRTEYARNLLPNVVVEAGIPSGNLYEHIDPEWGDITQSEVDRSREISHSDIIRVDPSDVDRGVDSFSDLDWLIVAEALNAWIADLHLGGPSTPPRGGDRVETLMNAAVCAAGYTDVDDILPLIRRLFDE